MDKPNTTESVQPLSGSYSPRRDLRLNAWFLVPAAIYLVALILERRHSEWSPLPRALLTMTPLLPGMLYIRSCMRFVRSLDELQRRIQLESWLFAALGTLIIGAVINTLNADGVPLGNVRHGMGIGGTFVLTFALWLAGSAVANRRYK